MDRARPNQEWVKPFFDTASEWWGRPRVRESDHKRMALFERMAGAGVRRVLELGAGGGTTAAVMAQAGYDVTAVELSSARAGFIRQIAAERKLDTLHVVEGDFYELTFGDRFDAVTYWNGFGLGSDEDQQALLQRVRTEWLDDGGSMILDVMSPFRWARIAGQRSDETHAVALVNTNDFDPVACRYFDTWWPEGHEDQAITQSGRCYTPADFMLLVAGTGLTVARMEIEGKEIDASSPASASHPLWDAWEYTVQLRCGDDR